MQGQKIARKFALIAVALTLSACGGGSSSGGGGTGSGGGGGGGGGGNATTLTGQFKDSIVQGLSYSTPSRSGTTDSAGRFEYLSGETVSFSVGGVALGSAPGRAIVTPIELVPDGGSLSVAVQNIVRFLMMLDQDGDPANGITISASVRSVAAAWSQVDFSTDDLEAALTTIISDVASVDSRTPMLPDPAQAQAHLESTIYCEMSGAFAGTYSGDRSGTVVFLVNPATGQMIASATHSTPLNSAAPPGVDRQRAFAVIRASDDADFTGRFDSFDQLSGVWSIGGDSGEFTASRLFGSTDVRYRYSGVWDYGTAFGPGATRINMFDVRPDGTLSARFHDFSNDNSGTGSGAITGSTLTVNWDNGSSGTASVDLDELAVSGNWTSASNSGVFEARGCRLN